MIQLTQDLKLYFKNPKLEKDSNINFIYRFKILVLLTILSLFSSFFISFVISFIEILGFVELGKHSIEELFEGENHSTFDILLFAVVYAPILEELIFRAPLTLFKNPAYFKYAFYVFALLFGYMHIFNYQDLNSNIILFSPILVAPQVVVGLYLGFIRIKFGLQWSIALHALFNGILMSLFILAKDAITQI